MCKDKRKILMEFKKVTPTCETCFYCKARTEGSIPDPTCHVWEYIGGRGMRGVMWLPENMKSSCKYHQPRVGKFKE